MTGRDQGVIIIVCFESGRAGLLLLPSCPARSPLLCTRGSRSLARALCDLAMATMDDSASDLFSDRRLLRELADLRFNAQRVAVKRIPRQDVTLGGGGRGGAARKAPPRVDAPTNERPAISLFDVLDDEGEPPKGFLGRLWGAVKPVRAVRALPPSSHDTMSSAAGDRTTTSRW